jgi:phytoene synthase
LADGPAEDLDALIRRVHPDRWLSSRFIADPEKRADVIALYAFDYELRRAVEGTSNAIMAEIRLTWWSEALEEIYHGRQARRHPAAEALERVVRRSAPPREVLEAIVEARMRGDSASTEAAVSEGAALILDPGADPAAVRAVMIGGDRAAAGRLSPAAFPAVAHLALVGRSGIVARRLRLTLAVATGRL